MDKNENEKRNEQKCCKCKIYLKKKLNEKKYAKIEK